MKHRFTLPEKLLFLSPLAFGFVAWLFVADPGGDRLISALPLIGSARENSRRSSCQSNLKQIGLGFMQYVRDYDEQFPPISSAPFYKSANFGWAEILQPYLRSTALFQCPSEKTPANPVSSGVGYSDYFYNSRMARSSAAENERPGKTILVFEGVAANARAAAPSFPKSWVQNSDSPLYRHFSGSNLLFADGRVKWLKNEEIRDLGQRTNFRFELKAPPPKLPPGALHKDTDGATYWSPAQ